MKLEIKKGWAEGSVSAPPSKSMAHRSLICGAFSKGSEIKGVAMSEDIEATLGCLRSLGASVSVCEDTVYIGGMSLGSEDVTDELFCNESGSTLRFMIPICLLFDREITLRGSLRLFQRSLDVYSELCQESGLLFQMTDSSVTVKGPLKSGVYNVRGDVSSQFISGLLFALPHLEGESVVHITGEFESASYVELTLNALKRFGVKVERPDDRTFVIRGKQTFENVCEYVEGDYSNAAFFEAMKRLGHKVSVTGLDAESAQGDRVYSELFDRIEENDLPIDISDCPDLAPILFAYSAVRGKGVFTGTRRLAVKESHRALAMKEELAKFGAEVAVMENSVQVSCKELTVPSEVLLGHNDHRIVMALAVLCSITGGIIDGAEAVAKSFPDFFQRLRSLGIEVCEI